jgi:DNA-directed RNA polymerase subunit RPC12/RpoP
MKLLISNESDSPFKLPRPVFPAVSCKNDVDRHSCESCEVSFVFKDDLINHQSLIPSSDSQKNIYKCTRCSLKFSTFRGMKQHLGKIHEKKKNIPCLVCGKLFKDKYAIKFHNQHVHEVSQKVRCEKCSFLCYTKYVYQSHILKCQGSESL